MKNWKLTISIHTMYIHEVTMLSLFLWLMSNILKISFYCVFEIRNSIKHFLIRNFIMKGILDCAYRTIIVANFSFFHLSPCFFFIFFWKRSSITELYKVFPVTLKKKVLISYCLFQMWGLKC